ncbi:MAG: hypothetical protein EZS28_003509 [Streblomastix strix]|uniref:Reverse transcriptase RNase H-like domain-containing protein n=1 Tax=Streblomastix strix TaxID=222440 RepID=A0A5J4X2J9_9EUKA|nr:MAG: hypothetical protein EZS28_003509 [Streblomastix strix]
MQTIESQPQGWEAILIYENQIELIQHDFWTEKEIVMTCNHNEIKAVQYSLHCIEQVFKSMQYRVILTRSDNTTAVYVLGKWKTNESLIERIMQVLFHVKRLQLQITTIHIQGKLNSTTDSLSRLCRPRNYALKD